MKVIKNRTTVMTSAATAMLGLALISLSSCSSGDSTTGQVTTGGSAGLQGPIVFVNSAAGKSLTSVALRGDSGNAVLGTIESARFEEVTLGDMQFSKGEWVFVNIFGTNSLNQPVSKVATIDPLTNALPVHKVNLPAGTRPAHLYRDPTDGEIMWVMNDGNNEKDASGNPTPYQGDDLVNCVPATPVPDQNYGSSVTILHNSHQGPGAHPPEVEATVCVLADGHKVTAFSSGTGVPKRAFVSSETGGEIAVIDNEPGSPTKWTMTHRIDLCNPAKETDPATCDAENPTGATPFTPNNAGPHGIRWSKLTQKVYSIQEGYGEIAEIDPTTLLITRTFDLAGTPYTSYGITPDGRFLLLRGQTTAPDPQATKLGMLDISVDPPVRTDFTAIAALNGTSPGAFKFSPDGNRFYILAGNAATATKKDRLFAFDSSTLALATPALTLLREIPLVATGAHSFDVLVQTPTGAPVGTPGEAKYIAVSNSTDNSLSIINAIDNQIKQTIANVGSSAGSVLGGVMIYSPGAAAAGNQASS